MKVNAGPEMLDMLLNAAGQHPAAGDLSALLPLLQGLGGSSGGAGLAGVEHYCSASSPRTWMPHSVR